jgi:hypothetical protein
MTLIIIGIGLIILQLLSVMGTLKAGDWIYFSNVTNFKVFLYDLIGFTGYSFIGILGIVLLVNGIRAYRKGKNGSEKKEVKSSIEEVNVKQNQILKQKKSWSMKNSFKFTQSKKIALIVSVVLCVTFYLSFLTLAFTEKTNQETYICYTTKTGTHFHSDNCKYLNTMYQTTVYEACKKYKPCEYCDPFYESNKTKITITERNYLVPALISIPLSTIIYIALINDKKDDKERNVE